MRSTRFVPALAVMVLAGGCSRDDGDPPAKVGAPTALGRTLTLAQLQDPASKDALKIDPPATCATPFTAPVVLDGVTVNWVDQYDETGNGDLGTVWVQDFQSKAPYSGSSLFSPSYVPSSLYVAAGDVLDLRGLYDVLICLGPKVDFHQNGSVGQLAQIATPTATFRFEGNPVEPVEVPFSDFASFETGQKWIGMLVRFKDVTFSEDPTSSKGRTTVPFDQGAGISLDNAFQDIGSVKRGNKYASVTGVVTWFFDFKLSTRTPEDLVPAQ